MTRAFDAIHYELHDEDTPGPRWLGQRLGQIDHGEVTAGRQGQVSTWEEELGGKPWASR